MFFSLGVGCFQSRASELEGDHHLHSCHRPCKSLTIIITIVIITIVIIVIVIVIVVRWSPWWLCLSYGWHHQTQGLGSLERKSGSQILKLLFCDVRNRNWWKRYFKYILKKSYIYCFYLRLDTILDGKFKPNAFNASWFQGKFLLNS